jgi:cell division protein FtsB
MYKKDEIPDVLKRVPCVRIPLLQEIDWENQFYLMEFKHKLESEKTNIEEHRCERLWSSCTDLSYIFIDIALIVLRINEDCRKVNRHKKLFDKALKGESWTNEEGKEIESLHYAINYLNLDVRTLLVNVIVFMDSIARFLSWTIKAKTQVKSKSFVKFRKNIAEYKGKEVQQMRRLLDEKTHWFNEIKKLRDNFIIHHAAARSGLEILDGETHVPLTTSKGGYTRLHITLGSVTRNISMKEIDAVLSDLKCLLKNLNNFLCERINQLPIKIEEE